MTPYKPGNIILIPFPFTDFSTFKQRPALVISSSRFNQAGGDVIIAALSSHLRERNKYEYRLSPAEQHAAGLPLPSVIKLGKIITLDKRLIRKSIGGLPSKTVKNILAEIHKILSGY